MVANNLPTRKSRFDLLPWLIVAVTATLPFISSLDTPLLGDDIMAVVNSPNVQGKVDISRIFTTNSWGSVEYYRHIPNFRPLSVLTLAVTRALAGTDPLPYKTTNLLLHLVATLLLLHLLGRVGIPPPVATLATMVFAVHPIHAEALLFAVNREEILAAIFLLLMLGLAIDRSGLIPADRRKRWTPASLVLLGLVFAMAVLSKESGATGLIVVPLLLVTWPRGKSRFRAAFMPLAVLMVVFVGYIGLRFMALGHLTAGFIPFQDNPLVLADTGPRLASAMALVAEAATLLVAPLNLSIDYSWNVLGMPIDGFPARSIVGSLLVLATIVACLLAVGRRPVVALGLGILVVTYGLVSNIVFLNSMIFGERLLYLPSVGATVALAGGLELVQVRAGTTHRLFRLAVVTVLAAWVMMMGTRSFLRSQDYRTATELLRSSLAQRPGSTRLLVNLGVELTGTNRHAEATALFSQALEIDPLDAEANHNLGVMMAEQGRPGEAAALFQRAIQARPGFPKALGAMCLVLESTGRDEAALEWCLKAAKRGAKVECALLRLDSSGQCRSSDLGDSSDDGKEAR